VAVAVVAGVAHLCAAMKLRYQCALSFGVRRRVA